MCESETIEIYFFKFIIFISLNIYYYYFLYFIDYAFTTVPTFPLLPSSTQHLPLSQAIPTPSFMSMGHTYKYFSYSISYTVPYIPRLLPICTS